MTRLTASLLALAALVPQFRTEANAVRIEALILDNGRPVIGLTPADLVVTDNGQPQAVRVRPLEGQPIDVAIVLDVSASVRGGRLDHLRASATALAGQLGADDRATLLTFDHALSLGPRDVGAAAVVARLDALIPQGRTSLIDAVTTALVWGAGRERPMLVFVFSDGEDTASWTRPSHAIALARASDAVVDVIVAGNAVPSATRLQAGTVLQPTKADAPWKPATPYERFLAEVTSTTGGRARNGGAGAALTAAFRDALASFRARYEITYAPTGSERGWHAVEVRVPGKRGVAVHARSGYER